MNRINLITLGVKDVAKAARFYRDGLGFATASSEAEPNIVFFNNGGTRLALYPLKGLEEDVGVAQPAKRDAAFPGITLAYNAKSKDEVDRIFEQAAAAGANIVKAPQVVFWGGYSGYFQDLDGYYWEVAYGDFWQFDDNDMLVIPG